MRIASYLVILICVLSLSMSGQQAARDGSEAAIRTLEHEWVEGQERNNNRALDLIFDNALVYVEYGKLVTKGEYLSRVKWAAPNLARLCWS